MIWNLKTTKSALTGKKLKVNNINKLTKEEKTGLYFLIANIYSKDTGEVDLFASTSDIGETTFKVSIDDQKNQNKVVSTMTLKIKDYVEQR